MQSRAVREKRHPFLHALAPVALLTRNPPHSGLHPCPKAGAPFRLSIDHIFELPENLLDVRDISPTRFQSEFNRPHNHSSARAKLRLRPSADILTASSRVPNSTREFDPRRLWSETPNHADWFRRQRAPLDIGLTAVNEVETSSHGHDRSGRLRP